MFISLLTDVHDAYSYCKSLLFGKNPIGQQVISKYNNFEKQFYFQVF